MEMPRDPLELKKLMGFLHLREESDLFRLHYMMDITPSSTE